MMADRASDRGPGQRVMPGKMSAHPAYRGSLETAARVGRANGDQGESGSETGCDDFVHLSLRLIPGKGGETSKFQRNYQSAAKSDKPFASANGSDGSSRTSTSFAQVSNKVVYPPSAGASPVRDQMAERTFWDRRPREGTVKPKQVVPGFHS